MLTKPNKVSKPEYHITVTDGVITFTNPNTTLGFVRFKSTGAIEYIFVQPQYRKLGLATKLVHMVREITGQEPVPEAPVSPLGRCLFKDI